MKVVVLAGGYGTRLTEETSVRPKPMVNIGNQPILWHVMKIYSAFGLEDFIVCCGYKGHVIKEYFANYLAHMSDVTFDLRRQERHIHRSPPEGWRVMLIDTGEATMTGGRLRRIRGHLDDEPFCVTYGDGVGSIDIAELIRFHRAQNVMVTLTAVRPPGRFGALTLAADRPERVARFREKPEDSESGWVSGGFFVVEPAALDYIDGDDSAWEGEPLEALARDEQLAAYRHHGFWQPMDTLRDKNHLEQLWHTGAAPWKTW